MKAFLRMKDANMEFGQYDQIHLPNLHSGLVKELKSDSSQLSKFLEHNYFSTSKIPGRKFRYFHKGYRPSLSARLRLFYLYVVVHEDWRVLQSVFRMKKTSWPKEIYSIDPLNNLNRKEVLFLLGYKPNHEYDYENLILNLKPWSITAKHENPYSRDIPEHLFNRFLDAYECTTSQKGKTHGKRTNLECKSLKQKWEDEFYVNYVKGNYNSLNLLLKQHVPSRRGQININNAHFEEYNQSFAVSAAHFGKWRLNTYRYVPNLGHERRKDIGSLYGRFGIKNYGRYVSTIMNNAWIFFSEDCKSHHFSQEHKRGAWKFGLGGRGNGYHRLGAARIIAHWDDDEKLQRLRSDFTDLECIKPFKSTQHAKDFCTRWEGNFIIPENEVVKPSSEKTEETFNEVYGTENNGRLEYTSLKEGLDFLNRNKNPERANTLWRKVVKNNHSLQHKYFSKSECDMAASYILRWLHRPRI